MATRKKAATKASTSRKKKGGATTTAASFDERKKALGKSLKKHRSHKRRNPFEPVDIEDGRYIFRLGKAGLGQYKGGRFAGELFFSIDWTVADKSAGEAIGSTITSRRDLVEQAVPWDDGSNGEPLTFMDLFIEDLQSLNLSYIDFDKLDEDDLPEIAKRLSNDKPYYYCEVKTKTSDTINQQSGQPYINQNVFIQGPVSPDTIAKLKLPTN